MKRASMWALLGACLLLALNVGHAAESPTGWICISEVSTGFHYDAQTQKWSAISFESGHRYLVRKQNEKEKEAYQNPNGWRRQLGMPVDIAYTVCKSGKECFSPTYYCVYPPNETSGNMSCVDTIGIVAFVFNIKTLRMQEYYFGGYMSQGLPWVSDTVNPDTPFLEIGTCSPL